MTGDVHDVVVIGAGLSGLHAGHVLHQQGLDVLVLEGRPWVSGRQLTVRRGSWYADMGGAYVGTQQTKVLGVIKELGLQTYPVDNPNHSVLSVKEGRYLFKDNQLMTNPLVLFDVNHLLRTIDKFSKQVPIDCPWKATKAQEWDSINMEQFMEKHSWNRMARAIVGIAVKTMLVTELRYMSALGFLHYVHANGGIEAMTRVKGGLQEMKILGGAGQISDRLAQQLSGRVVLDSYVDLVIQQPDCVEIKCSNTVVYRARQVILAIPLPVLNKIHFEPGLPQYLQQLASIEPKCRIFKVILYYKRNFWNDQGLSGETLSEEGLVSWSIDDTKHDGTYPAIMGFLMGDNAERMAVLTKEERKRRICEHYACIFKLTEFLDPVNYEEKSWQDEDGKQYGGCSCVHSFPPGVITKVQRSPGERFERLHFAGTEMAKTSKGYMDGALRSAEMAAKEVLEDLERSVPQGLGEDYCVEVPYMERPLVERYLPNVPQFLLTLCCLGGIILALLAQCWINR